MAKSGLSRTTLTIIVVAAVAVVAIIAVWFFVVRGSGGASPFLGAWKEPGQGTGAVVIKKHSGDFKVTMSGKDGAGTQKTCTIPAHLAMKVEGTPVGGSVAAQDSRSSVVLVKDD